MTNNKSRFFSEQFAAIADEVSMLMIACDIDISLPDCADKILSNDYTICRQENRPAFDKLRHHLLALYPLEERSIERIGADQTKDILDGIRQHLAELRDMGRPGGGAK